VTTFPSKPLSFLVELMVENHLDIGGAIVFWNLAEWTDRGRLRALWAALDLEPLVPDPRPAPGVLRSALESIFAGPRVLIRPLASRDGFTVVREDRGLDSNRYQTDLSARVIDGDPPTLTFEPWDSRAVSIQGAYQAQMGRVSASQVSSSLVRIIESLGGTRLRPSGAVYWLPGNRIDEWSRIADAVEQAADGAKTAIYMLRHRLDHDAVRAVRDAVITEVQSEAQRICDEVTTGELGGRALETRKKQAAELRAKVLLYEDLLSVGLDGLHGAIDRADQAAATATLLLGANSASPISVGAG
jgi:hypothetical protein